jgi:hypothetical protein
MSPEAQTGVPTGPRLSFVRGLSVISHAFLGKSRVGRELRLRACLQNLVDGIGHLLAIKPGEARFNIDGADDN